MSTRRPTTWTMALLLPLLVASGAMGRGFRTQTTTQPDPVTVGQSFYVVGCGYRAGDPTVLDASWDTVRYLGDVAEDGCIYDVDSPIFVAPTVPGTYTVDLCQPINRQCHPMGQATVTVVP